MKKSLLALASLCAFAGVAHAQSNVTLYGIVDAGLTYVSNAGGSKNFKLGSGNLQGSRWGLRGAEDLGGGLKAIFVLENGFSLNNGTLGQGGRMFGRQAYIGLSSATAGTVTIGRQYDSVVDFVGPLASGSQWATFSGAHVLDNDNLNNSFRINNSIKYTTANYNGFSASALYGFSNQANTGGGTGFANNRAWSVGAGYSNGPLTLGAGYLYLGAPNALNNSGGNGTVPGIGGGAVSGDFNSVAGGVNIDRVQIYALGGSYAIGPATLGAVYSHSKYDYDGASAKFDNIELNGKYMLTPAMQLGAAYTYTRLNDEQDGKVSYHQIALGANYWLSKRTDAYLVGLWQHVSGDTFAASLNGQTPSLTGNQLAVTAGIRHKF
ncbi:porin [Pandoraea faecigallinarum]|uniref:Porin n=1 Tax=Pandoraea faecigallinarum TaxID=656179 RepID=A0A0H3WSW0_9BURK|nr:porin [Pandoraea faecigallinarum]AKM31299.1 porin [Pandoraea faecigallinarum]